jgi:putative ABC transport system permease protein
VTLQTDQGYQTFPVAGIYYDYTSDQGTVLMSDNIYHRYWQDREISSMGVFLAPGANADRVSAALRAALTGTGLLVQANAAVRQEALAIFDRTFAITAALRVLAVVVAFIGVVSALMALQLERRRELATLQALGLPPASMWALSLLETGLMGLMAGVLSLPTGLFLAWALIAVVNLRSFGWTIRLMASPYVFVQALLVGVAAALLAAIYPGLQARRESIAEGLRQE